MVLAEQGMPGLGLVLATLVGGTLAAGAASDYHGTIAGSSSQES